MSFVNDHVAKVTVAIDELTTNCGFFGSHPIWFIVVNMLMALTVV